MNKNEKGFSIVELLLLLILIGLIGFIGWYVWNAKNKADKIYQESSKISNLNQQREITKKASSPVDEVIKPVSVPAASPLTGSSLYNFTPLEISMAILPGWSVESEPTQSNGANYYNWTVSKSGVDSQIVLNSQPFQGGFENCGISPAAVNDLQATKNPKLMFLSWTNRTDNQLSYSNTIVLSDEAEFKISNDDSDNAIRNDMIKFSDLKTGSYYYCFGYPRPGFNLKLNTESTPSSYSRLDSIRVNKSLSPSDPAYPEIKAMLTSIK